MNALTMRWCAVFGAIISMSSPYSSSSRRSGSPGVPASACQRCTSSCGDSLG